MKNLRIYLVLKSVINSRGKWNFALRFSWTCSYSVMFFIYHRKVLKNIVSDKLLVAAKQEIKKKNMLIYHSVQFKSFRSLFIWKEIFSVRTNGRKSEKIKKTLTVEILRTEIEILWGQEESKDQRETVYTILPSDHMNEYRDIRKWWVTP